MGGNTLYIFVMDPAVPGADYSVRPLLYEGLPEDEAARAYRQIAGAIVPQGINQLNLSLTTLMGTGQPVRLSIPKPAPAATPSPSPGASSGSTLSASFAFQDGTFLAKAESRVMETNSTWWKYAWKLTLTNKGKQSRDVVAVVEFQDGDGFPIDQSSGERATVSAGDEIVLTGFELIDASVAPKVGRIDIKLLGK
jgi:hypothetical protein